VVAHLLLYCCLPASNKLVNYCLAKKISNRYFQNTKDPRFCPKAGDFFPDKAWHINSWFFTANRVKAAGTEIRSCQQDCSEADIPPSKQRVILLGAGRFVSVLLFPHLSCGLSNVRNGESISCVTMIKLKEKEEEVGKKRNREAGIGKQITAVILESSKSESSANSCSLEGHRVLVSLSVNSV